MLSPNVQSTKRDRSQLPHEGSNRDFWFLFAILTSAVLAYEAKNMAFWFIIGKRGPDQEIILFPPLRLLSVHLNA